MVSNRAKPVHELLGKPLIRWVIDAAQTAGSERVFTVLGYQREQVIPLVEDTTVVVQEECLGTGHAIMVTRVELEHLASKGASLVVLNADTPLILSDTIRMLAETQQSTGSAVCLLAHNAQNPAGYGRVILGESGQVLRVVEDKDANEEEKRSCLCNSGAYCFDLPLLLESLGKLGNSNAKGEYYLTDVFEYLVKAGESVVACMAEESEAQGINDRRQLALATKLAQERINTEWMLAGVTMLDPSAVWIGADVKIDNDVEILPQTMLSGSTTIGHGSVIGPNTRITDSIIGRDCRIDESILISCELEDGVNCGPRAYLRPGTLMKLGSKAGTHVEIKNSVIGIGSKVPHLSYLGDATVGSDVNIGAGTITCNFDGDKKYKTIIENGAFIGSDTMLVAPVVVGEGATIGAGSTITKEVPAGSLTLERSEQKTIKDWAAKRDRSNRSQKNTSKTEAEKSTKKQE
jgi:bifunctional UDP-N-acetylglucosamine pyrophosphorylase/glucosamine-1-phosphate N-acetyltransferase